MQILPEGSLTGMTDKQFQFHLKSMLRHLERIFNEMTDGKAKDELLILIEDLREALSRP